MNKTFLTKSLSKWHRWTGKPPLTEAERELVQILRIKDPDLHVWDAANLVRDPLQYIKWWIEKK